MSVKDFAYASQRAAPRCWGHGGSSGLVRCEGARGKPGPEQLLGPRGHSGKCPAGPAAQEPSLVVR